MKCSECNSECCKFDLLGNEVISNIASAVRMIPEDFMKIFHERKTNNGFCPYLKNNKCSIYDERPNVCRDYFCNEWEPEHI